MAKKTEGDLGKTRSEGSVNDQLVSGLLVRRTASQTKLSGLRAPGRAVDVWSPEKKSPSPRNGRRRILKDQRRFCADLVGIYEGIKSSIMRELGIRALGASEMSENLRADSASLWACWRNSDIFLPDRVGQGSFLSGISVMD